MSQLDDRALQEVVAPVVDDIDLARAQEYALLATLLARSAGSEMLERLAVLRGDTTPLGIAHTALAEAAAKTNAAAVKREYFMLFEGVGRSQFLPYASHYLTGSLYGRTLVQLRGTLQRLGIKRTGTSSEPEDHVAMLCEIMARLASGEIAAPASAGGREISEMGIFETYVAPWMSRFFADLERAEQADFYARVGLVGRTFLEIESQAIRFCST
jgi:TorA maturation chaperone TorD